MTDKKDMVVKETNEIMVGEVRRGFERVDMSKITVPRAKLLQLNSPELSDEDYNFKAGQLIHGLLMEELSPNFIPISIWESNILFNPRNDLDRRKMMELTGLTESDINADIICTAEDAVTGSRFGSCAECGLCEFNPETNEKPICRKTINVLALFEGQELPVVLSFAATNFKYGRRFRDMALYTPGDLFSRKYKVATSREQNEKGTFFTMQVKPAGKPTEDELARAVKVYEQFAGKTIVVDESTQYDDADEVVESKTEF